MAFVVPLALVGSAGLIYTAYRYYAQPEPVKVLSTQDLADPMVASATLRVAVLPPALMALPMDPIVDATVPPSGPLPTPPTIAPPSTPPPEVESKHAPLPSELERFLAEITGFCRGRLRSVEVDVKVPIQQQISQARKQLKPVKPAEPPLRHLTQQELITQAMYTRTRQTC